MITITLHPHTEPDGAHRDRFAAYLDDTLICVSRSGWHAPARELLSLGHDPETLMTVQHVGRAPDPTMVPQRIGELAKWTIEESDRGGMRRRKYSAFWDGDARTATDAVPGTRVPDDAVAA